MTVEIESAKDAAVVAFVVLFAFLLLWSLESGFWDQPSTPSTEVIREYDEGELNHE